MSGVYIKGMGMPNNCGACPLRLVWCRERIYAVTRPERCPIVLVPPHGRLGNFDEFLNRAFGTGLFNEDDMRLLEELVGDSSIVITAEEGE